VSRLGDEGEPRPHPNAPAPGKWVIVED